MPKNHYKLIIDKYKYLIKKLNFEKYVDCTIDSLMNYYYKGQSITRDNHNFYFIAEVIH